MVMLFLASYGSTKRAEVTAKLTEFEQRKNFVQGELAAAEKAMADVRAGSKITDLERPYGRAFQHIITLRLNQLELEQNNLILLIKQAEADIKNLSPFLPPAMGPELKRSFEEVKHMSRHMWGSGAVRYEDKIFRIFLVQKEQLSHKI